MSGVYGGYRRWIWLGIIIVVALMILPVANLMYSVDNTDRLTQLRPEDQAFARVAPILGRKCASCHLPGARLPFYFDWPIAASIMSSDIEAGTNAFDLHNALLPADEPVNLAALAHLTTVLDDGSMPPGQYLMMHWNASLGVEDVSALGGWIAKERMRDAALLGIAVKFANDAMPPLPPARQQNPALVALGDRLFHDPVLSGDGSLSCATCHNLDAGGVDGLETSTGIRDQKGPINAPTVYNAAFSRRQFWDGRAADLEEQAGGPVTNPVEMGGNWPDIIAALKANPTYVEAFAKVYADGITQKGVQQAIAAFEKTLITTDSPYDAYLLGDENALDEQAKRGLALFEKLGCPKCHAGPSLGGQSFEYMGLKQDYFAKRGHPTEADLGRYNFSKREADRHKFKVPTLRNIAQTAPYFHDGSVSSLPEAVRVMAQVQLGVTLTDEQTNELVAFLNALTGKFRGKPVGAAAPGSPE